MATPKFNSKSPTIRRILKEAAELSSSPSPDYTATPLETDLFEWHFTLRGPPHSAFAEGIYHGRIVLPSTYPLRPPMFRFSTPSGRFEANREICLSISGHHEETWQPAWGVRTALVALRAFMETDASGQIGGLNSTEPVRRRLASESRAWTCSACGKSNENIIREVEVECQRLDEEEQGEKRRREEVEVPAELRMGFRDEMMEKTKAPEGSADAGGAAAAAGSGSGAATTTTTTEEGTETAQLAEGFVQTAPMPAARPGQGVPQPTRTIPLPRPAAAQAPAAAQWPQNRAANADVPMWIDYAIMVLVGLLIAMLLKILVGY
ncbi:ubiquitin-conjugating enzyme [Apiospora phragmitis]|uniref:Ubiquitin-conjugating enzyme n=1 Tax=Apiospora phragmitis TaxID=2905665 RepID=A0ABR1T2K4_9PEZI